MYRLTESVEIKLPLDKVFAFLKKVEPRLRLNPFHRVLSFNKLTSGEIGLGTRFRIVLQHSTRQREYETEVVEFVENRKIVTRASGGQLKLSLTLRETAGGTLLTHDEEFVIPPEVLYSEERDSDAPLWLRVARWIVAVEKIGFIDHEKEKRIEAIKEALRNNLRSWLLKIKEHLEVEHEEEFLP